MHMHMHMLTWVTGFERGGQRRTRAGPATAAGVHRSGSRRIDAQRV